MEMKLVHNFINLFCIVKIGSETVEVTIKIGEEDTVLEILNNVMRLFRKVYFEAPNYL